MDQPASSTTPRAPADHAGRAGEDAWAAAAAAVLRKAGRLAEDAPDDLAWDRLVRRSVEDLPSPPLGTRSRAAGLPTAVALASRPGEPPFLRGVTAQSGGWNVRAYLADPDSTVANRSALGDLEGGVTSLWIRIGEGGTDPRDLAAVLDGVHLDMAPVVLEVAHPDMQLDAVTALSDLAGSRATALHPDSNLGADPLGAVARAVLSKGGPADASPARQDDAAAYRDLPELLSRTSDLGVRALVVDGTVAHDAGAGDAGEVGYTLAVGAAYLRALTAAGIEVDTACRLVDFRYAVTDEQFPTIAKLRAARLAWHRVAELCGAAPSAGAQRQHAVTSRAMLTRYDPWVNLLRTTVAAFAAGVGGAAAVTVLPYDSALGIPEEFGRRMARNISAVLIGESHLGAVTDPAGGAHAVEMLTADLAESAWAEFGRIEESGGILAALNDGSLAKRVGAVRAERRRRIATRRRPITGISEFPAAGERPPERRPLAQTEPVLRWSAPFEALRDQPAGEPVLMVTVGTQASAASRTLFTRNLLAAGGVRVVEPDPAASIEQAISRTGCRTLILAGSDAAYQGDVADLARRARAAGARAVFLAGRPQGLLADLPAGLIDGTVAAGDDVLAFLHTVRATLGGGDR
jgi:methylmalonyl-CoA mutase